MEPGDGPVLGFEQLLKVFYCENGATADLRERLAEVRAWSHERTLLSIDLSQAYLDGRGQFPQRLAINQLVGRFLDDVLEMVDSGGPACRRTGHRRAGAHGTAGPGPCPPLPQARYERRRSVARVICRTSTCSSRVCARLGSPGP